MHSFLRSIGFSNIGNRKGLEALLRDVCADCDARNAVKLEEGRAFVEYRKEFAPGCGLVVCGEMDENGFHQDYYFPYFKTDIVSSSAYLEIEKHGERDSFAGVCEDDRLGTSMIFYLQNAAEYQKKCVVTQSWGKNPTVSFTGLAREGKILLPVHKNADQALSDREAMVSRSHRLAAARNGDEDAIESLTIEDMDNYSMISRRIQTEDVFSIVDTFVMPYGMECDHYQLMGEIQSYRRLRNQRTREYLYAVKLLCNDMELEVCINEADLMGDPETGRRFKGVIWLQGYLNFRE